MKLLEKFYTQVRQKPVRVIYSEGEDPRVVKAAQVLLEKKLVEKIILIGNPEIIKEQLGTFDQTHLKIIDPQDSVLNTEMAEKLMEIKSKDYPTLEEAKNAAQERVLLGALLHVSGKADLHVAGAVETSAHVIRTFYSILKLDRKAKMATSFFLMISEQENLGHRGSLLFSDCAVNIKPNPKQLGRIAYLVGNIAKNVFEFDARVAFLTYSTKGSGAGEDVTNVIQAKEELAKLQPDFIFDSEYQADAALVPDVAARKIPNRNEDNIEGKANVLIFPDINAGNISYKVAQRFGNMRALGPVMVGLNYFASDLSRGCTAQDIVDTTAALAYYYLRSQ